jgi:hypothetical protein
MPQSLIEIIEVQQLFGKFSYVVPKYGNLISPTILYGDNGVGKSTILTIIFHLLSAANDKGHRTSLRKIPFKLVSVTLTDGVVIEAYRDTDNASAILHFKIRRQDATIAHWQYSNHENVYITELNDYRIQTKDFEYSLSGNDDLSSYVVDTITSGPVDYDNNGVAVSNSSYIKALVEFAPKMFYLSADRKLEGDSVSEVLPASDLRRPSPKRGTERALDYLRASRNASLDHALESAARWVNRRAVSDANRGTENTHSAYETILRQISAEFRQHQSVEDIPDIAGISTTVDKIELITDSLSKYEIPVARLFLRQR